MNKLNNQHIPIITIDGPSGTGKGTICHKIAHHLGWHYLDSGTLYRVLAWSALNNNVDFNDVNALVALALKLSLTFEVDASLESHTYSDGQEITEDIRTEACSQNASKIAAIPEVRVALLARQRAFVEEPGLVTDGRDMGTVVFPCADIKIFLFASVEERARRRFLQLKSKENNVTIAQVIEQLTERDARDTQRACAPLIPAENAIQIDTTGLSVDQVFDKVLSFVEMGIKGYTFQTVPKVEE